MTMKPLTPDEINDILSERAPDLAADERIEAGLLQMLGEGRKELGLRTWRRIMAEVLLDLGVLDEVIRTSPVGDPTRETAEKLRALALRSKKKKETKANAKATRKRRRS